MKKILYVVTLTIFFFCKNAAVTVGAERVNVIHSFTLGKRVGLIANHTSRVNELHLVDVLLGLNVDIKKIFVPEHGFRGQAGFAEHIADEIDNATGIPLLSLYGKSYKPSANDLEDVDVLIFDIQDVGVRFYTYITTLHFVMEACAEHNKKLLVLDRPNYNTHYVDGPVLNKELKSFVGINTIPIVYGLTIGELALMINGEGWLHNNKKCDLEIVTIEDWKRGQDFILPCAPSPNLPSKHAIQMYPSLCLFEGTAMSVGRGTPHPFEVIGHPSMSSMNFSFIPKSMHPSQKNLYDSEVCYGWDLRPMIPEMTIDVKLLIEVYKNFIDKENFFNRFFDNLAGTFLLRQQIREGISEGQIRQSWSEDLATYKKIRKKYLIYGDL